MPFRDGRYYPPIRIDDDYPHTKGYMLGVLHRSNETAFWLIVAGFVLLPLSPLMALLFAVLGVVLGFYTGQDVSTVSVKAVVAGIILGIIAIVLHSIGFTIVPSWT